jgi:hypothetical protein
MALADVQTQSRAGWHHELRAAIDHGILGRVQFVRDRDGRAADLACTSAAIYFLLKSDKTEPASRIFPKRLLMAHYSCEDRMLQSQSQTIHS